MHEIKFRAIFDGKVVEYIKWQEGNWMYSVDGVYWGFEKKYAHSLEQFTGLKDKNGREIYEGDIVRYDKSDKINHWVAGETAVVLWVAPRFTFRMTPFDEFTGSNQNLPREDDAKSFLTIIGHIYENPELLK